MKGVELDLNFNNKGLKKMFPGTKITKKEIVLAGIDAKFLTQSIKSVESLQFDYTNFQVADLELEGEWNEWILRVKLNVM